MDRVDWVFGRGAEFGDLVKDQGCFLLIARRHDQFPAGLGAEGDRKRPRDSADFAVQAEFPGEDVNGFEMFRVFW